MRPRTFSGESIRSIQIAAATPKFTELNATSRAACDYIRMNLEGKVGLVTGATSGIGEAIAKRFAQEGAHVVVNHRPSGPNAQKARAMVEEFPQPGLAAAGDVSQRPDMESVLAQILKRFGRIDVLVNNAGIEIGRPLLELSDADWDKVLRVNLTGVFITTQIVARQMVSQGEGGRIINISSIHEDVPFPNYSAYCTSKGGVRMLMRNAALELASHGITVNNIAPGAIATPINRRVLDDPDLKKNALGEIPLGRFGDPSEVAAVAAFLASAEAGYVTGSTYTVDGGMVRQVTRY